MLPASVRILVCTVPQDMRKSFDGLALAARQVLGEDPQSVEESLDTPSAPATGADAVS
jgi:hypothetical protein